MFVWVVKMFSFFSPDGYGRSFSFDDAVGTVDADLPNPNSRRRLSVAANKSFACFLDSYTYNHTMTTTTHEDDGAIPIIDFSPWTSPDASQEEKTRVSQEIFHAFSTIGFMVITHHGIRGDDDDDDGVTERAFGMSRAFFELDKETKQQYQYQSAEANRGYIAMGQEKLDGDLPDIKETFDIGFEGETAFENRWPVGTEIYDNFKETMLEYFDEYDKLHLNILRALARGMGFDSDDYFTPLCNGALVVKPKINQAEK